MMPKKKFLFKGKGPTLPRKEGRRKRLKEIKEEKGRSEDEQERISNNQSHKGMKLNEWTKEEMEAACRE